MKEGSPDCKRSVEDIVGPQGERGAQALLGADGARSTGGQRTHRRVHWALMALMVLMVLIVFMVFMVFMVGKFHKGIRVIDTLQA